MNENKQSREGTAKPSGHPSTVKSIEHVGSSGSHGVRFKMPKESEVCDHSKVRESKE